MPQGQIAKDDLQHVARPEHKIVQIFLCNDDTLRIADLENDDDRMFS
jgi:hypothetical protein